MPWLLTEQERPVQLWVNVGTGAEHEIATQKALLAHLLGGVGRDDLGQQEKGLEGLELKFNKELAGKES